MRRLVGDPDHRSHAAARGLAAMREEPSRLGERAESAAHYGADAGRVQQAIGNLIANALKFTETGGRVVASAEVADTEIVFRVADTGLGIDPLHLPHLFDRFWQARNGDRRGVGLGLAIAKGLIDAHGGRIWVESALGAGTTFSFALPRSRRAVTASGCTQVA